MVDKVTESVSERFNNKLSEYLPTVWIALKEMQNSKELLEMKFDQVVSDAKEIIAYKP